MSSEGRNILVSGAIVYHIAPLDGRSGAYANLAANHSAKADN